MSDESFADWAVREYGRQVDRVVEAVQEMSRQMLLEAKRSPEHSTNAAGVLRAFQQGVATVPLVELFVAARDADAALRGEAQ